jgi:hypothetical protein
LCERDGTPKGSAAAAAEAADYFAR